jgi:beta-lactam-binding protein with PASTA domain
MPRLPAGGRAALLASAVLGCTLAWSSCTPAAASLPAGPVVPDVRCEPLDQAISDVKTAGLQPVVDGPGTGVVMSQAPAPSTPADPATEVRLTPAASGTLVPVPNLFGRDLTDALEAGRAVCLRVSSSTKTGVVMAQDPVAGSSVAPGQLVTVVLGAVSGTPGTGVGKTVTGTHHAVTGTHAAATGTHQRATGTHQRTTGSQPPPSKPPPSRVGSGTTSTASSPGGPPSHPPAHRRPVPHARALTVGGGVAATLGGVAMWWVRIRRPRRDLRWIQEHVQVLARPAVETVTAAEASDRGRSDLRVTFVVRTGVPAMSIEEAS